MQKFWEKIKNILAVCGAALIAALLFVLGRRTHGRGGDSAEDFIADSQKRVETAINADREAAEAIDRGGERIADSKDTAGEIADRNRGAQEQLDSALSILEAAEKRGKVGKD